MLSRSHRFHGYNSLKTVYHHGRTVRGQALSLKYSLEKSRSSYRCAVVVSRKVHKSAVVRNRIRRRIYEVVRLLSKDFISANDLVFTVYDEAVAKMPQDALRSTIKQQLTTANVISRPSQKPNPRDMINKKGN